MKKNSKTIKEVAQLIAVQIIGLLDKGDLKGALARSEDLARFLAAIGVGLSVAYSEDEAMYMEKTKKFRVVKT